MKRKHIIGLSALALLCALEGIVLTQTRLAFCLSESLEGVHTVLFLKSSSFKRGDIVSIQGHTTPYAGDKPLAKRILGLAGDQIIKEPNKIRLEPGSLHSEDFEEKSFVLLKETKEGKPLTPLKTQLIPEGYVFVAGDHPRSFDSRYEEFGLVPLQKIWGKAVWQGGKGAAFKKEEILDVKHQCFTSKDFNLLNCLKATLSYCVTAPLSYCVTESLLYYPAAPLLYCVTTLLSTAAQAKDFGTHGMIAPIEEEDPIVLIQHKLKLMEESGELERHNKELQKKTKAAVERPKPVEGITKAQETRVFTYDPTYVVNEDLKDHTGKVFYKKGTKINPLETGNLSQDLLFFDGDDPEQRAFAQQKLEEGHVKLILVKGAPLSLSEEFQTPVYFDQGGHLTKKLGIHHVPALVTQSGLRLRIEEACPWSRIKSGMGIQLNGKSHTTKSVSVGGNQ